MEELCQVLYFVTLHIFYFRHRILQHEHKNNFSGMSAKLEEWGNVQPWYIAVDCPACRDGIQLQPQPGRGAGEAVGMVIGWGLTLVEWSLWGGVGGGEQGYQHIPPSHAGKQKARSVLSQKDNNHTNKRFSSMARSSRAQGCRANTRVLVLYVDMGLFMQYNTPSSQAY